MADPSLPPLIQQMLHSDFYPHSVVEPIRLIQTHISYVLLTGDYAYKVKKPANFGFLDFTTLEQRQHFCQEELRLNRRLSPQLYLAVLPIAQSASGQYSLVGDPASDTPAVEYTVKMQQFQQEGLFSHLFEQGELTLEQMQQLGQLVAQFHSSAQTNPDIQQMGTQAAVSQVAENSYQLSVPFVGRSQTQAQLEQTQAFSDRFFTENADWFVERQREDKIRECHGDLHLNNICLHDGKIQVFDCIEFNREFREIDVIYDAAFMVMDLEFQGRIDLANAFLNAYLERTGDYWGAAMLPLYLSMRAYIRGNVSSLALNDPAIADAEKQQFLARGTAYYQLAWKYTQRQQGQIWIMSGLSGSGKTTVARQVAQRLNAIHIRSDAVRKQLAGIPLDQRGDQGAYGSGIYTPEMTQKTYDRLLEIGLFLAQQGLPVVLDAKYDRQDLRHTVQSKAENCSIPFQILYCTAPAEILRQRLDNRKGDIADATADLLTAQQQATEPFTDAEQAHATTIHTHKEIAPQLAQIF